MPNASQETLRTTLEHSPIGISVLDVETGARLLVNSALLEMFKAPSSDALFGTEIALTWVDPNALERAFSTFQKGDLLINFEAERLRLDGTKWWVLMNTQPIQFGEKRAGIVWHIDITARKTAEQEQRQTLETLQHMQNELIQSEKMASLGGLVAGVAHEINSPVGVSLTAASHLEETASNFAVEFEAGSVKKTDLTAFIDVTKQSSHIISANLKRAIDLIGSFKQVAVDQTSQENRTFLMAAYLDEVLLTLAPEINKNGHKISIQCNPKLKIESFPGALSQVFTNLIMNSLLHGFEGIKHGNITIDVKDQGSMVHIIYSDDGHGMEPDTCANIFEPFFTTKRGSGGSGLGMNIAFNLITQMLAGSISCTSLPGNGTQISMRIRNLAVSGNS